MNIRQLPKRAGFRFVKKPIFWIVLFVSPVLGWAMANLLIPSDDSVAFSYGEPTCIVRSVLLPGAMQQEGGSDYRLVFDDAVEIGGWPVLARQVCVEPTAAPEAGMENIGFSLWGGPVGGQNLHLEIPEPPSVDDSALNNREISISRPLEIELTDADAIHDYDLEIDNKTVRCDSADSRLRCQVSKLDLAQGKKYGAKLTRTFDNQPTAEVDEGVVATLAPLSIRSASIENKQVRYDSPSKFEITFSRPIANPGQVKLERLNGENKLEHQLAADVAGSKLIIGLKDKLERNTKYRLTLQGIEGDNGSTLDDSIVIDFATSGGPKVASVSVGSTGVATTANIVVTFDQPLKGSLDIAKLARIEGVPGAVTRHSPTQLAFSLNAKLCAAFSLHVDKGLPSGSNEAKSEKPWKFDSRTVCGTSAVIGSSVQGRPIIAHYFGNGAKTILFTGGIHGNELSAQQTMQGWVDYLYANAHAVIPANTRVVVVPNTNPDGIATGARNNANNVNLGRNFPTANWKADTDTPGGILKNGGGKSPGSEPETRALMSLTRQLRPRLEVSFHSQGYLVGANKVADSVAIGNIYAGIVGYRTMFYNAEAIMGYSMTGEYEGWMGEEMGIPAILIELPSHYGNYLPSQQAALLRMLKV